ncbi:MAG: cation-translocating P-type ATPase [Desulfobacteraceae bacterium]|nr:cation-translocating P-type ATPase [Desulfobacteraceae bacterium]
MIYQIKHQTAQRTRITVPGLIHKKQGSKWLKERLQNISSVHSAKVRPATGSVILHHPAGAPDFKAVAALLKIPLPKEPLAGVTGVAAPTGAKEMECPHVSGLELGLSGIYMLVKFVRLGFFNMGFRWIQAGLPGGQVAGTSIGKTLLTPASLIAIRMSIPILKEGLTALFQKRMSMSLLISFAVYIAILLGEPLTGLIVIWLINFSEWLETRTLEKTKVAVKSIMMQDMQDTWVVRDGVEVKIKVMDLVRGDIVSIRVGDTIPSDGIISGGEALVNESSMTGEFMPILKKSGDPVLAGTTIEKGKAFVQVEKTGEETRLAAIIRLLEEGEAQKAPIMRTAERFSSMVVPLSLASAVITFLLTRSIQRAMSMLIIACPCAVSISTPTAVRAAMGNAASQGSLIKGGRYLEAAGRIKALSFDKTGTLTTGIPEVSTILTLDEKFNEKTILQLAASSQFRYKHPMTEAVLKEAKNMGVELITNEETELVIGRGVKSIINGSEILVGSRQFMVDSRVNYQNGRKKQQDLMDSGKSILFVAHDKNLIGLIGVEDRLKDKATRALLALKAMGVEHISMLTGDIEENVRAIESRLPIDEMRWGQSPEDKVAWIKAWKRKHPEAYIAMVGDGVNDGPALAHAYLSFAMGDTGADVTIEHADIVLRRGDLDLLAQTISLGQKTLGTIKQNYAISIGLNLTGILLAGIGLFSPLASAFSHNVVTVAVVANSMKLLTYRADLSTLAGEVEEKT